MFAELMGGGGDYGYRLFHIHVVEFSDIETAQQQLMKSFDKNMPSEITVLHSLSSMITIFLYLQIHFHC